MTNSVTERTEFINTLTVDCSEVEIGSKNNRVWVMLQDIDLCKLVKGLDFHQMMALCRCISLSNFRQAHSDAVILDAINRDYPT